MNNNVKDGGTQFYELIFIVNIEFMILKIDLCFKNTLCQIIYKVYADKIQAIVIEQDIVNQNNSFHDIIVDKDEFPCINYVPIEFYYGNTYKG